MAIGGRRRGNRANGAPVTFKPRGLFGQSDPHVVIVGAGFAGLAAAHEFASTDFQVTLIDANNFHTFQPLLYQLATAGLDPADIAFPLRAAFSAPIKRGDTHRKSLRASSRWTRCRAVGRRGDSLRRPHRRYGSDNGLLFDTRGLRACDAALHAKRTRGALRNAVLSALEAHDALPIREERGLRFVVVGGGPTGVEVAGAIGGAPRHLREERSASAQPGAIKGGPPRCRRSGTRSLQGAAERLCPRSLDSAWRRGTPQRSGGVGRSAVGAAG